MKYIIANWKANKTNYEALEWIETFLSIFKNQNQLKVVICPPTPFLHSLKAKISQYPQISLGSQDISHIEQGPYTGEVTANSLTDLAQYTIIGHSERRRNFNETEALIKAKIQSAHKYNITPILCIRNPDDHIYEEAAIIVYEPESAISTGPIGKNETLTHVLEIKKKLSLNPSVKFIYGGNVTGNNCEEYLNNNEIDGVLVGSASLDPHSFNSIVSKV